MRLKYRIKDWYYQIRGFLWDRYSTIKPKHLPHTWCDRCTLMPHLMFQVLSDFIEKEYPHGYIQWRPKEGDWPPMKIDTPNGSVYAIDEMLELYRWWHEEYIPYFNGELYSKIEKEMNPPENGVKFVETEDGMFQMVTTPEQDAFYKRLNEEENKIKDQLMENMIRLVKVHRFMWT